MGKKESDTHSLPCILHLNSASSWRGGEQQVFYLATTLKERGIDQVLILKKNSELHKRALQAGLNVYPLPLKGEWDIYSAWKIATLAAAQPSILHAHTARAHAILLAAKLICLKFKKNRHPLPLVVSRRVDFPVRLNALSRYKYNTPLVDRYLAISQNVKRILIQDGIDGSRIRIAYSGIATERWKHLPDKKISRAELNITDDRVVIGNVAALVDHKDQKSLLRAMHSAFIEKRASLEPETKNTKFKVVRDLVSHFKKDKSMKPLLLIVGDGKLRGELESLAESLGMFSNDLVRFTGFRNDLERLFASFDIFVMSSKEEGLGTSVLDAMACGLPVVATNGGGLPEMVDHNRGGFVSQAADAEALGRNLNELFSKPSLRKRFGAYNKKRVKDFSKDATADATLSVYRELTKS